MGYMDFGSHVSSLITFGKGGNEYARIDGGGNFLLGTLSSVTGGKLHSVAANNQVAVMAGGDISDPLYPAFGFDGQIGSNGGRGAGMYLPADSTLAFSTAGSEAIRIDSSQNVAITGNLTTGTINGGDLRGEAWQIGRDTNDCISVGTTTIDFTLDNNLDMRLENDGDLHVDGNVIAYSTTISDERLKKDIVKIDNALDKVSQLNGYTFEYKADGKKSAGVIAQEVEKVMPSAIIESTLPLKMGDDDETEYKTVQYDQLHGLMIEAIKELKAEIEELKAR